MTVGKILRDNNNNDASTNKQMKSWSFRRRYLRNKNNSLHNNNARLFVLESNRFSSAKDIFYLFPEESNALHLNESRFKGLIGRKILLCSKNCFLAGKSSQFSFTLFGGMYDFFKYIIDKKQRRERIDCC